MIAISYGQLAGKYREDNFGICLLLILPSVRELIWRSSKIDRFYLTGYGILIGKSTRLYLFKMDVTEYCLIGTFLYDSTQRSKVHTL